MIRVLSGENSLALAWLNHEDDLRFLGEIYIRPTEFFFWVRLMYSKYFGKANECEDVFKMEVASYPVDVLALERNHNTLEITVTHNFYWVYL